jgi:predicted nucleic acid-binding protein
MRAAPNEVQVLLRAFSLLDELSIEIEAVELQEAIILAHHARLSLYDASYLWLARELGAELVTLDDKLALANRDLLGNT